MVALLDRGDAGADINHDASTFMAEDRREQTFRIGTGEREIIRVADAGRLDLDQHFAGARTFKLNGHDLKRFSCLNGNSGAYVHFRSPGVCLMIG
ncbi:hypothetical protein D3C80_707820 [compost metagenome]